MIRKFITYFENEGKNYTEDLISVVQDRLDNMDNIKYVVIVSDDLSSFQYAYFSIFKPKCR